MGEALVNPLPAGQPGPHVLPHMQYEKPQHLRVVQGGQILLCVLVVLWAPGGKVNTRLEREKYCMTSLICGI